MLVILFFSISDSDDETSASESSPTDDDGGDVDDDGVSHDDANGDNVPVDHDVVEFIRCQFCSTVTLLDR